MLSPTMRLPNFFRNIFPLRPLRLYRRGRPPVPNFAGDESLYRRFRRADSQNGVILPSALKFPSKGENTGQSVNRSRFSQPADALWTEKERMNGLGVFEFPVAELPNILVCPTTARSFTFFPKHVPLNRNYAHSEIWCDALPRLNAEYVHPTSLVKKELRARIQKHSRIAIQPEI